MYDMPFAPFIGINKHGQSFLMGCGFIRDEKTPSYVWLFETFLEAMQGKVPVSIITNQDGAMRCAIAQTFPNTNHRNCRWHIMDKFTGTIGPILDKDEKLEDDFKECMNYTVSPDEFEAKWQYQKIQDKCLVAQDGQDFRTDDKERRRWSRYPIEKHASTVYTKNLFYRFSKEFEKTAEYDVTHEGQFQYLLVPNNNFVYGYGKRTYLVTTVVVEESYYCECSKFDRDGMLCCHIMKILTRLGVKNIPQRYILKRWTQEAIQGGKNAEPNAHVPAEFIARGMPLNTKRTLWFTNLSTAFASLAVEGCVSKETYTVMDNHIKLMQAEIAEIK
ncbi:protein FAR1-RELATED SEQUENCE 3-like [Panicum virgatum]|uniref:protein FAR1-RELATED SEQUENCE 3-like n=1 Tax=Panicum virgatum TaxID=38727 RepID=UPI0019D6002F|nr:protein FAR1-RELATED SEQUENCE 3-like [Panicum virgatum]